MISPMFIKHAAKIELRMNNFFMQVFFVFLLNKVDQVGTGSGDWGPGQGLITDCCLWAQNF